MMEKISISIREDVYKDIKAEMEAKQITNRSEFIEGLIKKGLYPFNIKGGK